VLIDVSQVGRLKRSSELIFCSTISIPGHILLRCRVVSCAAGHLSAQFKGAAATSAFKRHETNEFAPFEQEGLRKAKVFILVSIPEVLKLKIKCPQETYHD